jgi:subtilisin family serine protease
MTVGSAACTVAVLDEGIEDHEDFNEDLMLPGYDYFNGDSDPSPDSVKEAHGMAVAGLIFA